MNERLCGHHIIASPARRYQRRRLQFLPLLLRPEPRRGDYDIEEFTRVSMITRITMWRTFFSTATSSLANIN